MFQEVEEGELDHAPALAGDPMSLLQQLRSTKSKVWKLCSESDFLPCFLPETIKLLQLHDLLEEVCEAQDAEARQRRRNRQLQVARDAEACLRDILAAGRDLTVLFAKVREHAHGETHFRGQMSVPTSGTGWPGI